MEIKLIFLINAYPSALHSNQAGRNEYYPWSICKFNKKITHIQPNLHPRKSKQKKTKKISPLTLS